MTPLVAGLADVEPIGLDDLVVMADLQTRHDRKYLIPRRRLADVLHDVTDLRVLTIGDDRSFAYESVYFDTGTHASYLGAARRRPRRFKARTRSYLDSARCVLEVKVKDGRGRTVKHRWPYAFDDRYRLTDAGREFITTVDQVAPVGDLLELALVTAYRRTTLVVAPADVRVTIDVDLAWTHPSGRRLALPDVALVETKTAGPPCPFDRELWRHGVRPVVISKYGTGLAAFSPQLPANKWIRVLRRHFVDEG